MFGNLISGMMEASRICKICENSLLDDTSVVTLEKNGCETVNKCSVRRRSTIKTQPGDMVHRKCRKDFTHEFYVRKAEKEAIAAQEQDKSDSQQRLRSSTPTFNMKEQCFYCGNMAKTDSKRKATDVYQVRSMAKCEERGDQWAADVKQRILPISDLPAADAVYHKSCDINFRTNKQIPLQHCGEQQQVSKRARQSGRPVDLIQEECFQKVVTYFEKNDDEQITVNDLCLKMAEYLKEANCNVSAYVPKRMKQRMEEKFKDKILITELHGRPNVITFVPKASSILFDFYNKSKQDVDSEAEKHLLIETAGKIIKHDIKQKEIDNSHYPVAADLADKEKAIEYLPESLRIFLRTVMSGQNVDLKIATIGQALMQAARPRVLVAPLQIGLGTALHHHFGSRFLIDLLYSLGLCSAYGEVKKFEKCASVINMLDQYAFSDHQFVQFSADNADHNLCTIDGKGTFHGMGMIASSTPASTYLSPPIERRQVTNKEIMDASQINIKYYNKQCTGLAKMNFEVLIDLHIPDPLACFNMLWKSAIVFNIPVPGWNGTMQMIQKGKHPGKATISFLPMIDLNPSDLSCIYTTLLFLSEQAAKHNFTPITTFDQPLFWKALMIITSEEDNSPLSNIVLRIGAFHTQMSFIGAIGFTMQGSGLQEILELIYASNTVPHMLSGKAISRAIRGLFIVDAVLNALLIAKTYGLTLPLEESAVTDDDNQEDPDSNHEDSDNNQDSDAGSPTVLPEELKVVKELLHGLLDGDCTLTDTDKSMLNRIQEKVNMEKQSMKEHRTANLWFQFMDQVDILKRHLAGERMGNWKLHMSSTAEMEPLMAAAGHFLYVKTLHIYLQRMQVLPDTHPEIHQFFMEGLHVVRRSDRFWAGLSTDLIIEQVLMRSMKSTSGLTRGRGMSELQRSTWLLSMPVCAEVNAAIQDLAGVSFVTSEQHKETTKARIDRDKADTKTVLDHLLLRSPFADDKELRNIMNGVSAEQSNADNAKMIGEKIIQNMIGKCVDTHSFQRKEMVVPMSLKTTVKINGESVQVDPQLLFQRLIATVPTPEALQEVFKYELCSYPSSLFDSSALPRKATKPQLADALWSMAGEAAKKEPQNSAYVLDGGALLHRVTWDKGATYQKICTAYEEHIKNSYGENTVIVFDGYKTPSIKDVTHMRRVKIPGPQVTFDSSMVCKLKREDFLSNVENKENFIKMLGENLEKAGHIILYAEGDADVLIVKTAVDSARSRSTICVGDDTDLLVLLLFHAEPEGPDLFLKPEIKGSKKEQKMWNIRQTKNLLDQKRPVSKCLLFMHAILGCDSTSHVFGTGKGGLLKESILKKPVFFDVVETFSNGTSTKADVATAGEKAMLMICGAGNEKTLDELRHSKFITKTASGVSAVQVCTIPPTSAAMKYHSWRVYFQVQDWIGKLKWTTFLF